MLKKSIAILGVWLKQKLHLPRQLRKGLDGRYDKKFVFTEHQGHAKKYSWRFRVVAIGLAFVVALLLAEGGMRIRQVIKYGTTGASVHEFATHEPSGLRIPAPGSENGGIKIDSRGFRNPELTVPKPAGRIRVAFLGASTTYCAEASGNEATWPHLVCARLQKAFPDVAFDFVNAGVPGYMVEHSSKNLAARVRELSPDVFVVYHATNDLSRDTRERARDAGLFDGMAENPSFMAKASVLWAWVEKNIVVRQRMAAAQAGEDRLEIDDPAELAAGFKKRLAALLEECKKAAPVVVVATFSWHLRADQDAETQLSASNTALFYMPYMSVKGLLHSGLAYNEAIREAGRESGVIFVEGEETIPGDGTHFSDSVHFADAGCERQADRIANALIRSAELKALVDKN